MISRVTALIAGFFALSLGNAADAMSCMANDEGKAQLCYHKSADGRCAQYGPLCAHSSKSAYQANLFKPSFKQYAGKLKADEVHKH